MDNRKVIIDLDVLKDFLATHTPEAELIVECGVIEIDYEGFNWTIAVITE